MRGLRLLLAVPPVLAAMTVTGAAMRDGPAAVTCSASAAPMHHATLVVEHGDGYSAPRAVTKVCAAFSEDHVTGDQLLARSGVPYATTTYGSSKAVCQIQDEPASYPSSCFGGGPYWVMFVSRGGGAWQYSNLGVSSQTFSDGDAEGFRYETASDPPPSPAGVCPPPATPAPTPRPVSTPAPGLVAPSTRSVPVTPLASTPSGNQASPGNASTVSPAASPGSTSSAPSPGIGSSVIATVHSPTPALGAAATTPPAPPPGGGLAAALLAGALAAALLGLLGWRAWGSRGPVAPPAASP